MFLSRDWLNVCCCFAAALRDAEGCQLARSQTHSNRHENQEHEPLQPKRNDSLSQTGSPAGAQLHEDPVTSELHALSRFRS